ncbi:pilin [Actinomadura sp. 7K507]|uniref:pilin n=1 Tax=Actinomadura sp. 7K507 TaxID=2530365 RepID=UPI001A9E1B10|nr:pilin [Actinomadura sp. 7K507]
MLLRVVAVAVLMVGAAVAGAGAAWAEPPQDLNTVVNNITRWLVGMLVSLATLFLTVGGIRYLLAGGDPGEVGKAKNTFKYAAIGYGIAVLAPVLVNILKGFVGA